MKMLNLLAKLSISLLLCSIVINVCISAVIAQEATSPAFITPLFPIRGNDEWADQDSLVNQTNKLKQLVSTQLPSATYVLRFDALQNPRFVNLLPESQTQEIGIFMEITKSLAAAAQVPYDRESGNWSAPNKIFLSGYSPSEREKIIDTVMNEFLKKYGHFPKTVGAWHVDAFSAKYLATKYGVTNIVLCADQYSTDRYQLWGSWWGVPYIPAEKNILVPAQEPDHRLPVVITHWAMRDPLHGYGGNVDASTFSLQVNDYKDKSVPPDYASKLLTSYLFNPQNKFGFAMIGIENDYDLNLYRSELISQFSQIRLLQDNNSQLQITTSQQFANWYHDNFQLSPDHQIESTDPLSTDETARWTMTTKQRLFQKGQPGNLLIQDLRFYYPDIPEPYYLNRNPNDHLKLNLPYIQDKISLPDANPHIPKVIPNLQITTHLGWTYALCIIICLITIYKITPNPAFATIITAGTTLWGMIMYRSGQLYDYGIGFWGPHGHDAVWHLAVIEHLSRAWNLDNPLLAGSKLQNYHLGYDLFQAAIFRVTHIPNILLYFHILPIISSLVIGYVTVKLIQKLGGNNFAVILGLLFTYIGGSAGWLVASWQSHIFTSGAESMFWAQQAISTPINPPFMWSYVMLLGILILLHGVFYPESRTENNQKSKGDFTNKTSILNFARATCNVKSLKIDQGLLSKIFNLKIIFLYLLVGLLPLMKIYAGMLLYLALGILNLKELGTYLKNSSKYSLHEILALPICRLSLISGIITLTSFTLLVHTSGEFPFVWSPGWFIQSMLYDSGRVNWPRLAQASQAYAATNQYHKWIMSSIIGIGIFYLGNFWIRSIGLLYFFKKNKSQTLQIIISILISSLLIPLFFIQKGTAWNTIQFLYYTQMFLGILTALTISHAIKNRFFQILTIAILITLNLPTTIGTLYQYLPYRAPARLPIEEIMALNFLKTQDPGTVLTLPFNESDWPHYDEPRPLRVYTSTAYVSAFGGHPVVLEDQINLEIMGLDWQQKRNEIQRFLITQDRDWAHKWIEENNIKYVYYHQGQPFPFMTLELGFKKIFDNGQIQIYKK